MSGHSFSVEEEKQVREFVGSLVRAGFTAREDLLEETTDYLIDDYEAEDLTPLAERLIEEEWAAHAREQELWDGPTDVDRLELAFEKLEKSGVVARHNFACCSNCGHAEIDGEINGGDFDGYVFYHQQDTEHAVEGGGLYLAYGSFQEENYEKNAVEIGQRIVAALCEVGLQPQWNGELAQRIQLPLVWRKRH